jgi:hypothetical protein
MVKDFKSLKDTMFEALSPKTRAMVFSFIPLAERVKLGKVCSVFADAVKHSYVFEIDMKKMQRAAFFDRHLDKILWNPISRNFGLPTEFFRRHEGKVDWNEISENPAIPLDLIEKHFDEVDGYDLMHNPGLSNEFYDKLYPGARAQWDPSVGNPDLAYFYPEEKKSDYWGILFRTFKFSPEWLEGNLDKLSNAELWYDVCLNINVSQAFFERHLDKVRWPALVYNKSLPAKFFENHIDCLDPTTMQDLSRNRNIPAEFFEKHARYVDWRIVLANCKLSRDFLERNLEHLDWSAISGNDSVPSDFLEEHLDKLDWHTLCLGQKTISQGFEVVEDLPPKGVMKCRRYSHTLPPFVPWPEAEQSSA